MEDSAKTLTEQMRARWGKCPPTRLGVSKWRAAVLLSLVPDEDGDPGVLFEVRARDLDRQPGEICFPGGVVEEGETFEEAAVRETCEELLVGRDRVNVIAPLFQMSGPGGTDVCCFLGEVKGYRGTFSAAEVDHIFLVPLRDLVAAKPVTAETELVTTPGDDYPYELIPGGKNYPFRRIRQMAYFYHFPDGGDDAVVWGMTATLVNAFAVRFRKEFGEG